MLTLHSTTPAIVSGGEAVPVTIAPAFDPAEMRIRFVAPQGSTVADILAMGLPAMPPVERIRVDLVTRDGFCMVDCRFWAVVRPNPGVHVVVRIVPGGQALRSVLSLLVSVAATALTGPLATFLGVSSVFGKALITAGLVTAGGLLLNALFPQQGDKKEKPNYVISGWQNEFAPDSPVPLVLGKVRYAPRYGARTYTEVVGDRLFLRTVFLRGYGPLVASKPRIGRTDLDKFDEIDDEPKAGFPDDTPLTLYAAQVLEESQGVELVRERERDDYGEFVGPYVDKPVNRFSARDASAASIILFFENGLAGWDDGGFFSSPGTESRTILLKLEHRLVGAENFDEVELLRFSGERSTPFFRIHTWPFPVRGEYEIQITRMTNNSNDSNVRDTVKLFAIQSHRPEYPINFARPLALRSIRVRATNQLNGTLDTFNEVLSCLARDWNGSAWVAGQETQNPSALAIHVLTGHWCPQPANDAEIDWPMFEEWHEECTAKNLAFNRVIDFDAGLDEVLAMVGAVGRGSVWWDGEKWTVTIDRPRTIVIDHISTRNASNIGWKTTYFVPPDGHRVAFLDETNDYEEGERIIPWPADYRYATKAAMLADLSPRAKKRAEVYADPVAANNGYFRKIGKGGAGSWEIAPLDVIEALDLPGITNPDQVWLETRRLQYERIYRNTIYTATQPGSLRRAGPGDMVMLARDVLVRAMHAGRVMAVSGRRIEVDAVFEMEDGQEYAVRWRRYTGDDDTVGESILRRIKTIAGESRAVTLVGAGEAPGVGDLLHFGPMAQDSIPVIIAGIDRGEDNASILQMLPAADEMHQRLAAEVPPLWDGRVGKDLGGSSALPAPPVVTGVRSGMSGTGDVNGLTISLRPDDGSVPVASIEVRHRLDGALLWSPAESMSAGGGAVDIPGYVAGNVVEWQPRAISIYGVPSGWGSTRKTTIGANDPTAPGALNGDLITVSGGLGRAGIVFGIASDATNITHVQLYHNITGTLDPDADALFDPIGVSPGNSYSRVFGDPSRTNLIVNGDFASDTIWTRQTGWSIGSGVASHAAGTASDILQSVTLTAGMTYRVGFDVTAISGGATVAARFTGGTVVQASAVSATGACLRTLVAVSGNNQAGVRASAVGAVSIDNLVLFVQTPSCAPQGANYFWIRPINAGTPGPLAGPFVVTVI